VKTIKPMRTGVLCRPFEHQGRCLFAVGAIAYFTFDGAAPASLLPDVALWGDLARELGGDFVFDEAMPKLTAEVLVTGSAYAPGGIAQAAVNARVVLGDVDKTVLVVGDRRWEHGAMTTPTPFAEMPLGWSRAFGGEGYPRNPIGRGFAPVEQGGVAVHPLPNLEHPARRVRTVADRPEPIGLGAMDFRWPQRSGRLGTYDQAWLAARAPGFADDMEFGLFNVAQDDQHHGGFFAGDEPFRLENLHPTRPLIEGRLPGVTARCFLTLRTAAGDEWREVALRLDTVHLLPGRERGALIFRGLVEVAEDDAADVVHLLLALEHLDAPKPDAHYREALDARLARGAAALLRDADLLPESRDVAAPPTLTSGDRLESLTRPELLMAQNLRRRVEHDQVQARDTLLANGLDPADYLPDAPAERPLPSLDTLPDLIEQADLMVAENQADSEAQREAANALVRSECAKYGIDYDATFGAAPRKHPIQFQAKDEMARLRALQRRAQSLDASAPELDALLDDPAFEARLIEGEDRLREVYRQYGHLLDAAARREGLEADEVRALVVERLARGAGLADLDLTGADLAGLDLRGCDLRGVFLDNADLRGCDLRGADLWRAVACRADLTDARLDGANVAEANFGRATLVRASFGGGVVFDRTVLLGADLTAAVLDGARFDGSDLSEAILHDASMRGVTAHSLLLREVDLSRARLVDAELVKCTLLQCRLGGGVFDGITLTSCVLVGCDAAGASFVGATADNLRAVKDCNFDRASFHRASLTSATMRETSMVGANLAEANLTASDFSGADLREASLFRAVAKDARFIRTRLDGATLTSCNLMNALLSKANLQDAVLDGANLFRADLARFRGRPKRLEDAFVLQARVLGPREPA
jgi:uncharacterized protein YjbI with pentapeptide repeats